MATRTRPAESDAVPGDDADSAAHAIGDRSHSEQRSGDPAVSDAPDTQSLKSLDEALLARAFDDRDDSLGARMRLRELAWQAARDRIEVALRRPEEFRSAVVDAAFLDVQNGRSLRLLAEAALDAGDFALARATARRAVMLEPRSTRAHGLLAEALYAADEADAGKAHLIASIFTGSDDPDQASRAVFDCRRRLVAMHPDQPHDFAEVAEALISRGAKGKAVAAFMNAAAWSLAPDLSLTLLRLCDGGEARRRIEGPAPLVLISQVQRSGGSLLAQLFDGHPEVFAHPHELQIGRPNKWDWPAIDVKEDDLNLLADLFELRLLKFALRGYAKADGNKAASDDKRPMSFSFETLVAEFRRHAANRLMARDVLDAYFRAFFAAWKEFKPTGAERYVTGFTPRLSSTPESMEGFFRDYPDGRFISCIRDPVSWYASSSRHDPEYASLDAALPHWRASTDAALRFARERAEATHLVTYEALVKETPAVMDRIADWLGIRRAKSLYVPTYAGQAIMPNSSYEIAQYGVHAKSLDARVDDAALARIRIEAIPLYEEAVAAIAAQNDRLDQAQ